MQLRTQMRLPRTRAADQHDIALAGEEGAGGEVADQPLVYRGVSELEVSDLLGERQLGDHNLVLDRPCVRVGDLRLQQIADDVLNRILALDRVSDHLVIGKGNNDGDHQTVKILTAITVDGLDAVESAAAEALASGVPAPMSCSTSWASPDRRRWSPASPRPNISGSISSRSPMGAATIAFFRSGRRHDDGTPPDP